MWCGVVWCDVMYLLTVQDPVVAVDVRIAGLKGEGMSVYYVQWDVSRRG